MTSACLNQLYDDGKTISVASGWSYNNTQLEKRDIEVTFADSWSSSAHNALVITAANENKVLKSAEYVGMFAAMYNQEARANEVVTDIEDRYACIKSNAEVLGVTSPKPRVLWLYYIESGGVGGWSVGSCPNYYCEVIEDAGGDMIQYNETGSVLLYSYVSACVAYSASLLASFKPPSHLALRRPSLASCLTHTPRPLIRPTQYYYLNDTELLSRATDADYLIYQGNFSWAYESKKSVLNQIQAVQNKDVFDTWGRGSNDWYESRTAEPDVFLEDMVTAINPDAISNHDRVWLRAPFSEAVGSASTVCDDVNATLELQADSCSYANASSDDHESDDDSDELSHHTIAIIVIASLIAAASLTGAILVFTGVIGAPSQAGSKPASVEVVTYSVTAESGL